MALIDTQIVPLKILLSIVSFMQKPSNYSFFFQKIKNHSNYYE